MRSEGSRGCALRSKADWQRRAQNLRAMSGPGRNECAFRLRQVEQFWPFAPIRRSRSPVRTAVLASSTCIVRFPQPSQFNSLITVPSHPKGRIRTCMDVASRASLTSAWSITAIGTSQIEHSTAFPIAVASVVVQQLRRRDRDHAPTACPLLYYCRYVGLYRPFFDPTQQHAPSITRKGQIRINTLDFCAY